MKDVITIGIPVYNVEKHIEKALLSALSQTYDHIEYIIVDDKGSDNSMDIVRSIIANHPRGKDVRVIEHTQNIGTGAGRNSAIEFSAGKYIFFMDSDDEIAPDCIKILYDKMQEKPVDFMIASMEARERNGTIIEQSIHKDILITGNQDIVHNYYLTKKRHVAMWNKLYDVSFLRSHNIKCIPTHLNEDNLFTFQVILNAQSCRYISDITYYYYDTPNSTVKAACNHKISDRFAQQYVECIDFKRKYIQNYSDITIQEFVYRYIIFQTIHYTLLIKQSDLLNNKEKSAYIKKLIKFPFDISEIKRMRNKLFFYVMYMVYSVPFTITCFKLIRRVSFP